MKNRTKIEKLAEEVRTNHGVGIPDRLDPLWLAEEECIELVAPEGHGSDFHGRIEFVSRQEPPEEYFFMYLPEDVPATRHRFACAHELGHYFIPHHQAALREGSSHNSEPGFISNKEMEREADFFAGALLIPEDEIKQRQCGQDCLTLGQVMALATDLGVSPECAAVRYIQCTWDKCMLVVSEHGRVLYSRASDDADAEGFGGLGRRELPTNAKAWAIRRPWDVVEGSATSQDWYSERTRSADLYEESVRIGYRDRTITILSFR